MNFMYLLGTPLGYVMEIIYNFVANYGWDIIIFTVAIRLATLPLTISQQKSTVKMSAFQPMIKEIQDKYKDDQTKMNAELQKFQTEYGYNPMGSCLPMFANFFIIFGVLEVMYRPLQRILHVSSESFTAVESVFDSMGIVYSTVNRDTNVVSQILAGTEEVIACFTAEELDKIMTFTTKMDFFGIDLLQIPQWSLAAENLPLLIFPVLSVLTMFISTQISMSSSGQQMQGSMKIMMYAMPLIFVSFCFQVPCAFSLYYTVSNILMIVQSAWMRKKYNPEKMKAELQALIDQKKKEQRQGVKKTVVKELDTTTGEVVEKKYSANELNRRRLEMARKLDEEKYADERTEPLQKTTQKEENIMIRELEKTGKTVEEAYEAACLELGVSVDDFNVSYEILEMPTRKLFRSIPAKVLVKVETEDKKPAPVEKAAPAPKKEAAHKAAVEQKKAEPAPKKETLAGSAADVAVAIDLEQNNKVRVAIDYLREVIACMGVVDVEMSAVQKGEATIIRIEGDHLGALIGRRGETMESLSYLASLVANREEGDYIKLGLDVAGYRDKREQDLTALAQRIGAKVVKNNRAFAMESMNPYERRLIHAAISEMEGLRSESIGEGKDRRVVIYSTAEGANNDYPETERSHRSGSNGNRNGNRGGNGRGGYRNGGNRNGGNRGGNRNSEGRPPRTGAPRPKSMPERDFTPVDAADAAPVAPKRTERIDDMADFGFGKIEF